MRGEEVIVVFNKMRSNVKYVRILKSWNYIKRNL